MPKIIDLLGSATLLERAAIIAGLELLANIKPDSPEIRAYGVMTVLTARELLEDTSK